MKSALGAKQKKNAQKTKKREFDGNGRARSMLIVRVAVDDVAASGRHPPLSAAQLSVPQFPNKGAAPTLGLRKAPCLRAEPE